MCLLALVLCVLCTLGYVSASTGKTYKPKDKVREHHGGFFKLALNRHMHMQRGFGVTATYRYCHVS